METKELLKNLSEAIGPSGNEEDAREAYINTLQSDLGVQKDDIYVDNIGNTIYNFGDPSKPRVMIAAHIDEVGYMITYIDDDGYLFFKKIGGMDQHLLPGRHVVIKSGKNTIPGIIGRQAIHNIKPKNREKTVSIEDCWIDIGAKNQEEASKWVKIGDIAVLKPDFIELGDHVSGKAFDDRAGVTALYGVIKSLYKEKIPYDVYAIATVQEEVGLKGAMIAAKELNPDIGIVLEVGFASDFPEGRKKDGVVKLGGGPVINYGCSMDRELTDKLVETAELSGNPYQLCADPYADGIDAYSIQTRSGAKCINVDIPLRYMHTPHEVLNMNDLDNAASLIVYYLKGELK